MKNSRANRISKNLLIQCPIQLLLSVKTLHIHTMFYQALKGTYLSVKITYRDSSMRFFDSSFLIGLLDQILRLKGEKLSCYCPFNARLNL